MPVSDFTPTVAELAEIMHARTQGSLGEDEGTFNENTNPTGDEAEGQLEKAAQVVALRIGTDVPDGYVEVAKHLVRLLAAAWIERSYQPEQATEVQTPYEQYMREFRELLAELLAVLPGDPGETTGGLTSIPLVSPLAALAAVEDDE